MDLTESIIPKSDQLNADDLMAGPVTVTIGSVSKGSVDQPVNVDLVEFPGRAFRPSKSMRRVMVMAWGKDSAVYVGRRLTLYREPEIKFGGEKVGGIRISHLSHIEKRLTVALTVTRGKRSPFTVEPLTTLAADAPSLPPNPDDITAAQLKKVGALMREAGITDRAEALDLVSGVVGRVIETRNDLTKSEAHTLIEHLEAVPATEPVDTSTGEIIDAEVLDPDEPVWPEAAKPGSRS